jgi:hypothetical protein
MYEVIAVLSSVMPIAWASSPKVLESSGCGVGEERLLCCGLVVGHDHCIGALINPHQIRVSAWRMRELEK